MTCVGLQKWKWNSNKCVCVCLCDWHARSSSNSLSAPCPPSDTFVYACKGLSAPLNVCESVQLYFRCENSNIKYGKRSKSINSTFSCRLGERELIRRRRCRRRAHPTCHIPFVRICGLQITQSNVIEAKTTRAGEQKKKIYAKIEEYKFRVKVVRSGFATNGPWQSVDCYFCCWCWYLKCSCVTSGELRVFAAVPMS